MLGLLLVVIGSVGASSGFMLWGIAISIVGGHQTLENVGLISTAVGLVALVVGAVLYRASERRIEASLRQVSR